MLFRVNNKYDFNRVWNIIFVAQPCGNGMEPVPASDFEITPAIVTFVDGKASFIVEAANTVEWFKIEFDVATDVTKVDLTIDGKTVRSRHTDNTLLLPVIGRF